MLTIVKEIYDRILVMKMSESEKAFIVGRLGDI